MKKEEKKIVEQRRKGKNCITKKEWKKMHKGERGIQKEDEAIKHKDGKNGERNFCMRSEQGKKRQLDFLLKKKNGCKTKKKEELHMGLKVVISHGVNIRK